MKNVLITSAGRRVSLTRLFKSELELTGDFVYAVDAQRTSPACRVAKNWKQIPLCNSPDYLQALLCICDEWNIKMIIPTIDTELSILAANRSLFTSRGIQIVVSSHETTTICSNKFLTADFLNRSSLPTVKTFNNPHDKKCLKLSESQFPVFIKPASGSSPVGALKVKDQDELNFHFERTANPIIQEFADGIEYTVNFFVDSTGCCVTAVPHERIETRAGEVSKCITRRNPGLEDLAKRITVNLPECFGPMCFQAITNGEDIQIIEINARFGGGYPITHQAGANFVKLLLNADDTAIANKVSDWEEDVVMLRYDDAVFTSARDIY